MFAEFRKHFTSLSAWVESCYSGQPLLHLDTDTIFSCRGVQQGYPLGPLGFALALHPSVERIKSEVHSLTLNSWYLDDGTLAGTPEALLSALKIVEEETPFARRKKKKKKKRGWRSTLALCANVC